jgi:hypothetical protein
LLGPGAASAARADDPEAGLDTGLGLTVEGGIEGWAAPGHEYPVRVTIETDRLVDGILRVHAPGLDGETLVEREVEVSGGSTARVDLVMPAWPADGLGGESWAELVVDGEIVAHDAFEPRRDAGQELVGLLPDAVGAAGGADALPGTVPLAVDLGVARPVALDTDLLALGALALEPLDQLVAAPAELAALPTDQRAAVAAWVQAGGQLLLVGDDLDAAEGALPTGWLPEPDAGAGVRAGLGQVRAVGDDWTEGLLPSPTRSSWEEELTASDLFSPPEPIVSSLGSSAGLRLPGGRGLALLLGAYVVLAGPVVFVGLRRLQRRQLTWVAIPLLAVGSTGVVFITGSSLRHSAGSAQVTVYETGPGGTVATSWSLLANREGGEVGVTLPAGWVAGGTFDDGTGTIDGGSPVRLATGVGGSDAEALVDSPVGGYGAVTARGPVPDMDEALAVTASSDAEGVIHGTVRNRLDVDLDEVAVFAGRVGVVEVGPLAAGEQRDFTLENATTFGWNDWGELKVWPLPDGRGGRGLDVKILPAPVPVPAPAEPDIQVAPGNGVVIDAEGGNDADARARIAKQGGVAVDVAPPQPAQPAPPPLPEPAPPVAVKPDGGRVIDPDDGGSGADSPVVMGAWAAVQRRVGWNYRPTGQVVAVGWTDELDAPVGPASGAGPLKSSRSAVVARATVTPAGDRLTDAAVVRSMVRGPVTEAGEADEVAAVWAFYLPDTVDGRPVDRRHLVMNQGSGFTRAQFWTPDGWVDAEVPATGQAEIAVPPAAVVDGVVVYRWAVAPEVPAGGGRDLTIYEKEAPR